jgi:hypothetical protein
LHNFLQFSSIFSLVFVNDILEKVEKRYKVQWMPDSSGKPRTKRSETKRSEGLQRIAGTKVDNSAAADSH